MGKPYFEIYASVSWPRSRAVCLAIRPPKQFGVAISTATGWMQRVKKTGSVEPSQIGGYKPKAISGELAV